MIGFPFESRNSLAQHCPGGGKPGVGMSRQDGGICWANAGDALIVGETKRELISAVVRKIVLMVISILLSDSLHIVQLIYKSKRQSTLLPFQVGVGSDQVERGTAF